MFCSKCGSENAGEATFCTKCGTALQSTPREAPAPTDETMSKVIPYRNVCALTSYYLGVFALIPCLGILLGLASVPLGIMGLKEAKRNPLAHGTVHAWVGIVLGSLAVLVYGFLFIVLPIMASMNSGRR